MRNALLFRESGDPILVSADDVRNGLYDTQEEFIDPKYEFKVQFVRSARNNGSPYFRYYYSYEEYKQMYPDRASRYEIVANMRNYQESLWHSNWKEKVSSFCLTEKCIKNPISHKWKFADAFYEKTNTCIEFQHSYIAWDFEERNKFYSALSINTVWLYDLPHANARQSTNGSIEILENNAIGFFRISEIPENLKKNNVYIQVKSGMIYRVRELMRRISSTDHNSTIRYFFPSEIYTEHEFIDAIQNNKINFSTTNTSLQTPHTIQKLWQSNYLWMNVRNTKSGNVIRINCDHKSRTFRDYSTGCIRYIYVKGKYESQFRTRKEYSLSFEKENSPIWILVNAKVKQQMS